MGHFSSSGKHTHHGCVEIKEGILTDTLMAQACPTAFICMLAELAYLKHVASNLIALNLYVKLTSRHWDLNPPMQCHRAKIFRAGF